MLVIISPVGFEQFFSSIYGPGVVPTYWWRRFATGTTIHLSAAALSTIFEISKYKLTGSRGAIHWGDSGLRESFTKVI
jgi:hypothetical protein